MAAVDCHLFITVIWVQLSKDTNPTLNTTVAMTDVMCDPIFPWWLLLFTKTGQLFIRQLVILPKATRWWAASQCDLHLSFKSDYAKYLKWTGPSSNPLTVYGGAYLLSEWANDACAGWSCFALAAESVASNTTDLIAIVFHYNQARYLPVTFSEGLTSLYSWNIKW